MTFKIGDKAVHPSLGVGEVMGIQSKDIAGKDMRFYVLKIVSSGATVMVATEAARRVGLRKPISRKQAKEVVEVLKQDEVAVTTQPWNRRQREYTEMLNSGSPIEVAKVLRDLYRLKSGKELSFGERRLLDQARNLLITELALARRCKQTTVENEIQGILE